jgi:hypothetical protein
MDSAWVSTTTLVTESARGRTAAEVKRTLMLPLSADTVTLPAAPEFAPGVVRSKLKEGSVSPNS